MANDYFKDILPQPGGNQSPTPKTGGDAPANPERSIRNISVSSRQRPRVGASDMREVPPGTASTVDTRQSQGPRRRVWIWVIAAVSVIILAVLALFAFRSTTVTVTPRSHGVVLEQGTRFTALPAAGAVTGALTYTVASNDIEDSAVVPSEGKERVDERASGTVEVFNEYSSASVRLIKNTRFATPSGLVFRVPASIVIPGKTGTKPGSIKVTLFADQGGPEYNVGPVERFTLPGLKSSPDMYAKVYARSSAAMTGGFTGERPSVVPATLESARAEVRGRLEGKARDGARALSNATAVVFPDLIQISYESLPLTTEAGGDVRIHERAHIEVPLLSAPALAQAVARTAGANAENASIILVEIDKLSAKRNSTTSSISLGKDALDFSISGTAQIVWNVDIAALSSALAGLDNSAFQGIINGFPGIQEARARIEPFWKRAFPSDAADIRIELLPVQTTQ